MCEICATWETLNFDTRAEGPGIANQLSIGAAMNPQEWQSWKSPAGFMSDLDFERRGGPPKWMVKIMEHPFKMDDLGVPLFLETPT